MLLADNRVELDARPALIKPPLLEVALIGHCPSRDGAARWRRLAGDAPLLAEVAALGFARSAAFLRAMNRDPELVSSLGAHPKLGNLLQQADANDAAITAILQGLGLTERLLRLYLPEGMGNPADQDRFLAALQAEPVTLAARLHFLMDHRALYNLPIPLFSFGQFQALFPDAFDQPCAYRSSLAGGLAWLPAAVQDFFDGDATTHGAKKLWILRVPEASGQAAFLPRPGADPVHVETLGAFDRALLIPRIGVLALPDLERLQVPVDLPDIPRLRLDNPPPSFRPDCEVPDDTHRERRYSSELPAPSTLLAPEAIVLPIIRALAQRRPDLICLLSLPLDPLLQGEHLTPSPDFLQLLGRISGQSGEGVHGELGEKLRHLQLLYPYLRGPGRPLCSATGLIAGMQATVSHQQGPWHSMAGRPMPGLRLPYPALNQQQATALRQAPGISVLLNHGKGPQLDDERLCVPCLPSLALQQLSPLGRSLEHWRSAEVMRFMGWIRRELQRLGERVVFDLDPRDPRLDMALRSFFTRLHANGALRGARPEEAFRLSSRQEGESTIIFDIELAPAYPLDLIRITFAHDRHAGGVETAIEASHG